MRAFSERKSTRCTEAVSFEKRTRGPSLILTIYSDIITPMPERIKIFLKIISVPLTLAILYLSLLIIWKILELPPQDQLLLNLKYFFSIYGLPFLFICAVIEGFFVFGSYFPGGIVIFLAVILAGHDIPRIAIIILLVAIAFVISYTGDYYLGKLGWYRLFLKFGLRNEIERAQLKLNKHAGEAIFFSYWDTSLASITATAAGVLNIPYSKFISHSVFSIIFWNTFWSVIIYFIGPSILDLSAEYMVMVVALWSSALLIEHYISQRISG